MEKGYIETIVNTNLNITLPQKIVSENIILGINRTKMPMYKIILLGILAGMFIAGGGAASGVAMHTMENVSIARLIGGCVFPVGLIMINFIGAELFTGDCLMIMGVMDKKYKIISMLRVLLVIYVSNFIGAVVFTYIISTSGQFNYTDGLLGAYTIKVATGKLNLSFVQAFSSAILCNVFVCGSVIMAAAAKDIAGKVLAIFFPIMAFVVSGYEHCVANMYYISAGIFAAGNKSYVAKAIKE